jgi:hypothetical protein
VQYPTSVKEITLEASSSRPQTHRAQQNSATIMFFFGSEQVTRAESSNPVPPLKSSDKRAVQPDRHHPARCSSAITSLHGHVGDAFGATC